MVKYDLEKVKYWEMDTPYGLFETYYMYFWSQYTITSEFLSIMVTFLYTPLEHVLVL